mgnify:CR=1 FL=1
MTRRASPSPRDVRPITPQKFGRLPAARQLGHVHDLLERGLSVPEIASQLELLPWVVANVAAQLNPKGPTA